LAAVSDGGDELDPNVKYWGASGFAFYGIAEVYGLDDGSYLGVECERRYLSHWSSSMPKTTWIRMSLVADIHSDLAVAADVQAADVQAVVANTPSSETEK
jgi:hypothetical protein